MKPAFYTARRPARQPQGMALVITLILLAVITFMAITFLVVSRSERGAVSTTTDQTTARIAADDALERAKSELLMPMLAFSNAYAFDMMVSTNYVNLAGFVSKDQVDPANVNFEYLAKPNFPILTDNDDFLRNLANLLYSPRVPVFMQDRSGQTHFQYYLDINRNGRPEETGKLVVTNTMGQYVVDDKGVMVTNAFVGDPEWVGGLEFPERPHSATNRFLFRYAYIVAPVGKTLDLNYMHNAGRFPNAMTADYFVRNQGVGTWELNMGAFLTDLNTNMWYSNVPDAAKYQGWGSGYLYNTDLGTFNQGAGFDDATALLRYRYASDWRTLWRPRDLFGVVRANAVFPKDSYDTFGSGPLVLGTVLPTLDPDEGRVDRNWPGAYNTNLFYTPNDLFDRNKAAMGVVSGHSLTDRLEEAGKRTSSYDRYTFHRLLSQLGTESAPEASRINVNYRNVEAERIIPNYETNFYAWTPLEFFTNAANRLLDNDGFTFTITNIQVYPTNFYTPAVHRALQLAANIFEATTNKMFPTIYRPHFQSRAVNGTNHVFIIGYTEVQSPADVAFTYHDLVDSKDRSFSPNDMVYGIPLVVGARKGFPNFNQFAMDTKLTVTRKLEFRRQGNSLTGPIVETNQMFTLALTNTFGIEFWNSYSNAYPRPVQIRVALDIVPVVTNEFGQYIYPRAPFLLPLLPLTTHEPPNPITYWRSFSNINMDGADGSMITPFRTNVIFMPQATYYHGTRSMIPITGVFERLNSFPVPRWKLNLRIRLRATVIDTELNRLIDFVNLARSEETLDIADILQRDSVDHYGAVDYPYQPSGSDGSLWATNRYGSRAVTAPTFGILNQIAVSQGKVDAHSWGTNNPAAIDFFRAQFGMGPLHYQGTAYSKTNIFYAPFSPTRQVNLFTSWEANDPLVHYTIGDLMDMGRSNLWGFDMTFSSVTNIGRINRRYEPWTAQSLSGSTSPTRFELAVKDPLVARSDDWDFPTNKLANVGWLGRVHRGTPWQTVYLKSKAVDPDMWMKWAGSGIVMTNVGQIRSNMAVLNNYKMPVIDDTVMSRPTNDWAIPDIFTAALVDNATRGQLSINQSGLAAWSAVLSGVPVLSNLNEKAWSIIQPAAVDPVLETIVEDINKTRESRGGTFKRLGEICSVPQLSDKSPYIDASGPVNDAVYERIPQQVLGLLRCDEAPRFVVYCYGQALKPANRSVLTSGNYQGMCTNYQVTAEVATRAVVRIEGAPQKPRVIVENFNVLPPD